MMQDYPKVLPASANVGFSTAPAWICYSPCKNNAQDAAVSAAQGVPAGSAWTAESDQYFSKAEMLRQIGVNVPRGPDRTFLGITAAGGARIVLDPSTATFFSELKTVFPYPSSVTISERSTLIVTGDVVIESLYLDGRLRIAALPGTRILVRAGSSPDSQQALVNAGDRLVEIPADARAGAGAGAGAFSEVDLMRGFTLVVDDEEFVTSLAAEGGEEGAASASDVSRGEQACAGCGACGCGCTGLPSAGSRVATKTLVYTGKKLMPEASYRAGGLFCEC